MIAEGCFNCNNAPIFGDLAGIAFAVVFFGILGLALAWGNLKDRLNGKRWNRHLNRWEQRDQTGRWEELH